MTLVLLHSWAPTGLVRAEHAGFLGDIASSLVANGIEVGYDVSTKQDPYDGLNEAFESARRRQCDFFLRLFWNCWGPLGAGSQKAIYSASVQAMLTTVPGNQLPLPMQRAINEQLGEIDCIVFDVATKPDAMPISSNWTAPMAKVMLDRDSSICPMAWYRTLAGLNAPHRDGCIGAAAPAYYLDPSSNTVIATEPQYH